MKLKKLIAALMAVAMTAVLVQPCFATSMAEITDFIDNPFDLPQMTLEVKARKSGTEDEYTSLPCNRSLCADIYTAFSRQKNCRYSTRLELALCKMEQVCINVFEIRRKNGGKICR